MKVFIGGYPGLRSKKERRVSVRIDRSDTWNMAETLALIVHPMLVQLKEEKQGSPFVDDADVPEELRTTSAPPVEEWQVDANHHARWEWVLDRMIWSFEQLNADWESQFHTGRAEIVWKPTGDLDENGEPLFYEMLRGPNDTSHFDADGYREYSDRIQEGLRLFGRYYWSLWD